MLNNPGVRMVRRAILVIRKARTIGIASSLALVSTEIFFFEEIVAKADRRSSGQRCNLIWGCTGAQRWFEGVV
jgi:hypothetical protein